MKKKLTIALLVCVLLVSTVMLTACGGSESVGGWVGNVFRKNYFNSSKTALAYEDYVDVNGRVVEFTAPASGMASAKVKVDFPEDKGVKVTGDVVKSTLPSTATFVLVITYEDLEEETTETLEIVLYKNGKSMLPITKIPSADGFQITHYQFKFTGVTTGTTPYIQFKNLKIMAVSK